MEKMYQNYKTIKNINPLFLLLALVVGVFFIFYIIKKLVFDVLAFLAPILLIAALIMNYRVVQGYIMWLWNNIRTNTVFGLIVTALSIVFFPVVSAYLAFRAYHLRGASFPKNEPNDGEYIKYQEIKKDDFLDISREKQKRKDLSEDYSDLI